MKWITEAKVAKGILWHRHEAVIYICVSLWDTAKKKTHCEADETKAALPEQVAPQTAAHDLLHELSMLEGQGD